MANKHTVLSIYKKIEAIEFAAEHGVRAAARYFKFIQRL
jgi:hypothetical protein